ncbi:MAG: hypothetical protein ACKVRN_10250 [Pyrinomonadaceae bacterium]
MTKITFLVPIVLLISTSFFFIGVNESSCEGDINASLVTIEGDVRTTEPETGKVFTPAWQALVFQRVDCKKCLSVATTDKNGHYELRVGEGKYRLIVNEDLARGGSALDPKQPKIIDAKEKVRRNVFDIKLIRHKHELDDVIVPSSGL